MEATQYPYSLKFSIGAIAMLLILMLLLLTNVLAANNTIGWVIYAMFSAFALFMIVLLVVRRLIPAVKGEIALQLDMKGISDYIRDISINWEDVENIGLVRGRSAGFVKVALKFESDYGKLVMISLRWVKGKDDEIYDTMAEYFDQAAGEMA